MRESDSTTLLRREGAGLGLVPMAALVLLIVSLSGLKACVRAKQEAARRDADRLTVDVTQASSP